jgi:hypothetical protein
LPGFGKGVWRGQFARYRYNRFGYSRLIVRGARSSNAASAFGGHHSPVARKVFHFATPRPPNNSFKPTPHRGSARVLALR